MASADGGSFGRDEPAVSSDALTPWVSLTKERWNSAAFPTKALVLCFPPTRELTHYCPPYEEVPQGVTTLCGNPGAGKAARIPGPVLYVEGTKGGPFSRRVVNSSTPDFRRPKTSRRREPIISCRFKTHNPCLEESPLPRSSRSVRDGSKILGQLPDNAEHMRTPSGGVRTRISPRYRRYARS